MRGVIYAVNQAGVNSGRGVITSEQRRGCYDNPALLSHNLTWNSKRTVPVVSTAGFGWDAKKKRQAPRVGVLALFITTG